MGNDRALLAAILASVEAARQETVQSVIVERERCAQIAEHWDEQYSDRSDSVRVAGLEIATKIRRGTDA